VTLAVVPDAVVEAPVSFLIGVLVGFVLSNRYRITRRNGKEQP
jgi:hypothetical protein